MIVVFLVTALAAVVAVAANPHSTPVVVRPVHRYSQGLDTQHALFHTISSLPDTPVPSWILKAVPTTVYRPKYLQSSHNIPWDPIEVLGPDIEDKHTLSQLARISGNAYALPGQQNWYDIDSAWNIVSRLLLMTPYDLIISPKELSFRLGRRYNWLSRARFLVFRQQYRHTFNQRHHTSRTDVQEG